MSVNAELIELNKLLAGSIFENCFYSPAKSEDFAALESETGIVVNGGLKALWSIHNGAEYRLYGTPVFGVETYGLAPCGFLSIAQAIETWKRLQEWQEFVDNKPRDPRIQSGGRINSKWLPFAEFNGEETVLFFDATSSVGGTVGQIIAFQHDPDAMHFLATNFEEFFHNSNILLRDSELNNWIKDT
jgi:cell wall assembly regulator SMI1